MISCLTRRIDAVAICSSTDTHAKIVVEAARAGKHIFCEKPVDHDLAKIDAALEAVKQAGVKLQIGFNRRFDPNFAHVREMVAQGKVGVPAHPAHHQPRPKPAASFLCESIRGYVPGYDHP